jgi:hypothetical protein
MEKAPVVFLVSLTFLFGTTLMGCRSHRPVVPAETTAITTGNNEAGTAPSSALPHILVYKTRKDYTHRVPVGMDASKTRIVSYPHPSDLSHTLPTPLSDGYLLDNRGIGPNVVFLTYTYEAYCKLKTAPDIKQLTDSILDKNPLIELWDFGTGYALRKDTAALNLRIRNHLEGCTPLIETMRVFEKP